MKNANQVLADALRLSAAERATVVAELLDSLDEIAPADGGVEEAWIEEAQRRLAEVDAGTVTTIPWAEARRRILAAANGRRETP